MLHELTEGDPKKVLIVEDDTDLANLFAVWLGETYTVQVAHDCETAYALLDQTVDVVLLDRNLPDESGDEVLAAVRHWGLDCRVAMVTATEPTSDIVEMGFDDYLCKPATKEELRNTVEQLIAQADYGEAIQELYALASKKALLETHCSSAELATDEKYARLEARFEELHQELNRKVDAFSEAQLLEENPRLRPDLAEGGRS